MASTTAALPPETLSFAVCLVPRRNGNEKLAVFVGGKVSKFFSFLEGSCECVGWVLWRGRKMPFRHVPAEAVSFGCLVPASFEPP
jgi:hypothetical protein